MLAHILRRAVEVASGSAATVLRPTATALLTRGQDQASSPWLQTTAAAAHPWWPPSLSTAAFLSSSAAASTSSSQATQAQEPASGRPAAAAAAADASSSSTSTAPAAPSKPQQDRYAQGARKVTHLGRRAAATGLHGIVHVFDAASNMILTFTDASGRVLTWVSSGSVGFKNSRKGLPVAAEKAAEELARRVIKLGYATAAVKMKGIGNNKQYAVQSLAAAGLRLTQLMDVTPVPYNGCRRPKKRRV